MLPDPSRDSTVLIIEDEAPIRRLVRKALEPHVKRVSEAGSASEGIDLAAAENPDLIILDLGLPDAPGIEVCREIRKWSTAPILVLSARHSSSDKIQLLDAGADDFITKPFSTIELTARARACLRRARAAAGQPQAEPIRIADLVLDLAGRTLKRQGQSVHLTPIEWDLLRVLVTHAGRTLTQLQLFSAAWGHAGEAGWEHHLRVHMANLRRKVEGDPVRPRLIITEPGVGYRFDMPGCG
jgi:two-component system KDP operon response regulator KdpE